VAFENRDGSVNLRFDFLPADPATTIQVREMPIDELPGTDTSPVATGPLGS
jgi:hypothetical protein